jgi:hypothetical protein
MPRTPACLTQADIARSIRAAKQAGAEAVEIRTGGATIRIILTGGPIKPIEPGHEVIL